MGNKPKELFFILFFFVLPAQLGGCFPATGVEIPDSSDFDGGADTDTDTDSDTDPNDFCPDHTTKTTFVTPSTDGPETYADICSTNSDVLTVSNRTVEAFLESSSDNINEVSGLIRFADSLTEHVSSSPEVMLGSAFPEELMAASISKPTGEADLGYLFKIYFPQGIIDNSQYILHPYIELSIWFEVICKGVSNNRQVVTTTVFFYLCQKNATSMHWVGPDEECTLCY